MNTPLIQLDQVTKSYPDGPEILRDLSFAVDPGQVLALVGPSGCGKTTTLKLINGLLQPSSGSVRVGDVDVSEADTVALRRGIGYVVQEAGLFPHMTVEENVELVPRLLGWEAQQRRSRSTELLNLMGLDYEDYGDRYPRQLSGGQRQRVGLARALAADPDLVLMDEPFGALDPITRRRLQDEFAEIQRGLAKTVVLVTHDMDEAFQLADQVGILRKGELEQLGSPEEIIGEPASEFVAQWLGSSRLAVRE